MAFPTQNRLCIIWMRNLIISSLLMSAMYFSRDLGSTVKRIATSIRDLDSKSALDELRKNSEGPRVRESNISTSNILASGECCNTAQQKGPGNIYKNPMARKGSQLKGQHNGRIPFNHSRDFRKVRLGYASKMPDSRSKVSPDEKTDARSDNLTWKSAETETRRHFVDGRIETLSNSSEFEQVRCVYTIIIKTGDQDGAGTESDISVRLSNGDGNAIQFKRIDNGHRMFEKGHTDTFVFADRPCVANICELVLFTDDYGDFSEWFVVRLQILVAVFQPPENHGEVLQEKAWDINEWLPKEDEARELYTIRDDCQRHARPSNVKAANFQS